MAITIIVVAALLRALPLRWRRLAYLALVPALSIWFYLDGVSTTAWMLLLVASLAGYEQLWRRYPADT